MKRSAVHLDRLLGAHPFDRVALSAQSIARILAAHTSGRSYGTARTGAGHCFTTRPRPTSPRSSST